MNHDPRRLEELLDREIETARSLSLALAAERAALTGVLPDTVQEAAAAKIRLLEAMERLETERRSLWGAAETPAPGISGAVAQRWRSLMELMAECRTANEVNGHIIHVRQNQVRQLIDIVRGGSPMTYSAQGKTLSKALRALARA